MNSTLPSSALVGIASLALACGTSPAEPTGSGGAGGESSGGGGGAGAAPATPPLAPPSTPEPIFVPEWKTCYVPSNAKSDPVFGALEKNAFTLPTGPTPECAWKTYPGKENGSLGKPFSGVLYAAAEIEAPGHVFARADVVVSVHGDDGERSPGDLYGSGKLRVPVVRAAGKHVVVVRALGGRGEAFAELFSTPDELVINTLDATLPTLVEDNSEERALGVAVLNVGERDALDLTARVEESEFVEGTVVSHAGLTSGGVTQLTFRLVPKAAWPKADTPIEIGLRVESPSLEWSYRATVSMTTQRKGETYARTFVSPMDGSTQYYGVVPPADFDPATSYGLVLSLHGASVEALGQAKAYSAKDWAYVVAATNRRPFGFDWEEYGRRDGIEVLEDAQRSFATAADRVYVTGHSMGGHGTWQFGTLFPGRFATIGPSAGWGTYSSYVNLPKPTGAFARSQASSDTFAFLGNLARRGVYAIHGTADDNVPFSEGQTLVDEVKKWTDDVEFHVEEGAGHWWDGDAAPGADCVDWPPLFDFMKARSLDPFELDFEFTTPSPFVSPRHSYVTILSQSDAWSNSRLESSASGAVLTLKTTNVRALRIDGDALAAKGITTLIVDGMVRAFDGETTVGPSTGKRLGMTGPLNEVFARPFCFVIDDDAPPAYDRYAAYLLSLWSTRGNGRGSALRMSALTAELRATHNLVFLGVPPSKLAAKAPFEWTSSSIDLGSTHLTEGGLAFVFPDGDRLSAVVAVTAGSEHLLYRFQPFRSAYAPPDYLAWDATGVKAAGFFAPDWGYVEGQ